MKRLLAAVIVMAAASSFGGGTDARADDATAAPADRGQPAITLISQTPYVAGHGLLTLQVQVSGPDPAGEQLEVLGFPQVRTRTAFGSAALGKVNDYSNYSALLPLNRFSGVIQIPVDEAAPAGSDVPAWTVTSDSGGGVFPIQLELRDQDNARLGSPLTTFLVWAGSTQKLLSVSLAIPFTTASRIGADGQPEAVSNADEDRLNQLSTVIDADSSVATGILSDPFTASGLRAAAHDGSGIARQSLANLAKLAKGGLVEVMPSTYSSVDLGTLQQAGLGQDIPNQLAAGSAVLSSVYGAAPSTKTWVVDGPLSGSTLAALSAQQVAQLIVPDADLTAVKSSVTFGQTTGLEYGSVHMAVLGADPGLTADFAADEPPVLAAERLLAELAMIQTEQPSNQRVVAALPPPGWQASPAFVSTLLGGLAGNPLVRAVTPSSAFDQHQAGFARSLANPTASPSAAEQALAKYGPSIQSAEAQVAAISQVVPNQPKTSASSAKLRLELLAAESPTMTGPQRNSILAAIYQVARRATSGITLPPSGSVTLTASRGQLPITILAAPGLRARIELRLTSKRLIFQPFNPPNGTCQIPTPTREICTLSLSTQNTTLKVPVQTRSSGVFPLDVSLYSPGGALVLAHDSDTVRSTVVSGVGVVLIIVAVASLLLWWGRDLRHGRRARRLIPSPVEEPEETEMIVTADPVVHQFFAEAAPEYEPNGHRGIGGSVTKTAGTGSDL